MPINDGGSVMESMADKAENAREAIKDKLRESFDGKIVRKDLTKKIKEGANVPVYVLEYLLGQYCNSEDEQIISEGVETQEQAAFLKINGCDFFQGFYFSRPVPLEKFDTVLKAYNLERTNKKSIRPKSLRDLVQENVMPNGVYTSSIA